MRQHLARNIYLIAYAHSAPLPQHCNTVILYFLFGLPFVGYMIVFTCCLLFAAKSEHEETVGNTSINKALGILMRLHRW